MKKPSIFFVLLLTSIMPLYTKKTTKIITIKPNTLISQYSIFDYPKNLKNQKKVLYLYPSYTIPRNEYLAKYTHASLLTSDKKHIHWGGDNVKITNDHLLTTDDYQKYKNSNIIIIKQDVSVKKITDKIAKKSIVHYSVISDNNKKINVYRQKALKTLSSKAYKYDFYDFTSHPHRIAILIDEHDKIVHILDNVKSEQDIFKAFDIQ